MLEALAGGGGGYSGGSSGGGYSGGSSGGSSGGEGDLIALLIILIFEYPALGIPLALIAACVFWFWGRHQIANHKERHFARQRCR